MITTLQKHHIRGLKRALNILIDHLNEDRAESAGWAGGMQIGGWLTGDQLAESGYIELSADSKKSDLSTRRYRITQKGIDALIRLGDTLTLKDKRTGTLRMISSIPGDYRLQLEIAGHLEWVKMTALDTETITAEASVLNAAAATPAATHVATLTSPEMIQPDSDDDDFGDDDDEAPATAAETVKPEALIILENIRLQRENTQLVKQIEAQRTRIVPADEFTTLKEAHAAAQRQIDALKKTLAERPTPAAAPSPAPIVAAPPETVTETFFLRTSTAYPSRDLQKYIREGWQIAHEAFVVQDDVIIHAARLQREIPALPAPETTYTRTVWESALDDIDEDDETPAPVLDTVSVVPDAIIGLDDPKPLPVNGSPFIDAVRRARAGEITMDEALAIGDERAMNRARATFARRRAEKEQTSPAPTFVHSTNLLKG